MGNKLIIGVIITSVIILIIAAILIWLGNNRLHCPRCKRFVKYTCWRTSDDKNYRGVGHGGRKCSHCGYKSYDYSNIPSD